MEAFFNGKHCYMLLKKCYLVNWKYNTVADTEAKTPRGPEYANALKD